MINLEEASTMSNFELVKEMLRTYHRTKDGEKAKVICNLLYIELCEEDE